MAGGIVVGITGASGAVYGVRTLEVLRDLGHETHLVVSPSGLDVVRHETGLGVRELKGLATHWHEPGDLHAPIASGSFRCSGMMVVPCSMKTLGTIASGVADNLLARAADVALKEFRPLVLVVRETPYSTIHLGNMLRVSRAGGRIVPASPGFYHSPSTVAELVDFVVGKALDAMGIDNRLYERWGGEPRRRGDVDHEAYQDPDPEGNP